MIAEAFLHVMAHQVKPRLTKPDRAAGLQRSTYVLRRQPAYSIRARSTELRQQAGCMAAVSTCHAETESVSAEKPIDSVGNPTRHHRFAIGGRAPSQHLLGHPTVITSTIRLAAPIMQARPAAVRVSHGVLS
jgi:hypothetical protein